MFIRDVNDINDGLTGCRYLYRLFRENIQSYNIIPRKLDNHTDLSILQKS